MIRAATLADVPAMVGLGRAFHRWAAPPWEWDAATVERLCAACVAYDDKTALVATRGDAVVGGLLGGVAASPLHGGLEAHEVAIFVAEDARGRGPALIRRFIEWGRARGAQRTVLQDWSGEAGTLYERLGFRPVSAVWVG